MSTKTQTLPDDLQFMASEAWQRRRRLEEKRTATADRILGKYPDACWTLLVLWAVYPENRYPGRLRKAAEHGRVCRQEEGGCYCGKYGGQDDQTVT